MVMLVSLNVILAIISPSILCINGEFGFCLVNMFPDDLCSIIILSASCVNVRSDVLCSIVRLSASWLMSMQDDLLACVDFSIILPIISSCIDWFAIYSIGWLFG